MKEWKRKEFLTILFIICMVLIMIPVTAFAAEAGSSEDNPVVCDTFASFKAAMEDESIKFLDLSATVKDDIPGAQDNQINPAITQNGSKVLIVSGHWTLSATRPSPDIYGPVVHLIEVTGPLLIKGEGRLIFKAAEKAYPCALLYSPYRSSDITVEGTVKLEGNAQDGAFCHAIYASGGYLEIKGGFFKGYNTIENYPTSFSGLYIRGDVKAIISGGEFSSHGPAGESSSYYGLNTHMLDYGNTNVKLKGGKFLGIRLPSSKELNDLIEIGFEAKIEDGVITIFPLAPNIITNIAITGVTQPADGGKAGDYLSYKLPLASNYRAYSVLWVEGLGGVGELKEEDTFVFGQDYTIYIVLVPSDGYSFAPANRISATVNNKKAANLTVGSGGNSALIKHSFTATASRTVHFNDNYDGGVTSFMVLWHGEKVPDTVFPAREGYTFAGWYRDSELITAWNLDKDTVTENMTLYAKWEPNYYIVTVGVNEEDYGWAYSDKNIAQIGEQIILKAVPKEGYMLQGWELVSGGVTITDSKFTMPASDVQVNAIFKPLTKPTDNVKAEENIPGKQENIPFDDIRADDWFADSVIWAFEKGMMVGTGSKSFSPDAETTRGMIVTILHRMEGLPKAQAGNFNDVAGGAWYSGAIAWAAENKIVSGYGNGKFGPDDSLTREQLVTILYNYSSLKGYDLGAAQDLGAFNDERSVSDYARTPMQWAVKHGMVTGTGANLLSPGAGATRAQMAAILQRYTDTIVKR